MFITNGQNPVRIEKDERRYFAMVVNDKMKQNKVYFERLTGLMNKYKFELREYFQRRPVNNNDMKVIETDANKNVLYLNSSNLQLTLN